MHLDSRSQKSQMCRKLVSLSKSKGIIGVAFPYRGPRGNPGRAWMPLRRILCISAHAITVFRPSRLVWCFWFWLFSFHLPRLMTWWLLCPFQLLFSNLFKSGWLATIIRSLILIPHCHLVCSQASNIRTWAFFVGKTGDKARHLFCLLQLDIF